MRAKALILTGTVLLALSLLDRLYPLSRASSLGDLLAAFFSAVVGSLGVWQSYRNRRQESNDHQGKE